MSCLEASSKLAVPLLPQQVPLQLNHPLPRPFPPQISLGRVLPGGALFNIRHFFKSPALQFFRD